MSRRNENEKSKPQAKIFAGIISFFFGLLWTVGGNSMAAGSPFGHEPHLMITGFGSLFMIASLGIIFSGIKELKEEKQETVREIQENVENRKLEEQTRAALARVEKSQEKKFAYCPYCGTAQDEDYKICESCGAGRKR